MATYTLKGATDKFRRREARREAEEATDRARERKALAALKFAGGGVLEMIGALNLLQLEIPDVSKDEERRMRTSALLGALAPVIPSLADLSDPRKIERWIKAGQEFLDREEAERLRAREVVPIVMTFPDPPDWAGPRSRSSLPPQAQKELRAAHFRYNAVRREWSGFANPAAADAIAQAHGGQIVNSDEPSGTTNRMAAE